MGEEKFCVDCESYDEEGGFCRRTAKIDLETGVVTERVARKERAGHPVCGQEAVFFTPKE